MSGLTGLQFSALFAEDDASDGNEDWDGSDYVRVFASLDGGPETQIFGLENDGSRFNSAPFVDTDLDGDGEGAEITDTFAEFSAAIPGTGSSLDLRIEVALDSGDEDVAIDDVTVRGVAPAPLACTTDAPLSFDSDGDGVQEGAGGGAVDAGDFDVLGTDPTFGEFAAVRNESGGRPVDLAGCSFVVFDPFDEDVTYADNVASPTPVAPEDVLVFATQGGDQALPAMTLPDGPGAFALVTGPAAEGQDVLTFVNPDGAGRVVAAVVYDEDREVFGSVQGGATEAEMGQFLRALAEAFGQATSAEGGAAAGLAVRVWPNPSAGRSHVAFGLAAAADVRVSVYDALGREVAVLAEGPRGPGRHTVALDGSALAPGVYAVRVSGPEAHAARFTVAR